jgi:hypothetical protein
MSFLSSKHATANRELRKKGYATKGREKYECALSILLLLPPPPLLLLLLLLEPT